jgi:hypothetical protein
MEGVQRELKEFSYDQVLAQEAHLRQLGVEVTRSDVYIIVKEADMERSLRSIFTNRVDGWWTYQERYLKLGICTDQEFDAALEEMKRKGAVKEDKTT